MEYSELIAAALKGRSVNSAAKTWGVAQKTLDNYVRGRSLPNYRTALILAREAGTSLSDVMMILAREEERKHPAKEMIAAGFRWLANASKRLMERPSAA